MMVVGCSLKSLCNLLYQKFIRFNLFNSRSTDPTTIRYQLFATRLYLATFLVFIFILTFYTSIHERINEDMIYFPKIDLYKKLQKKYPKTLNCPCTKLAIPYGTFVNVSPSFHQVCSSNFVSQSWIDFAFQTNTTSIWPMDIRTSLSAMWQLIAAACSSSTKLVSDALTEFSNVPLINSVVLSEDQLKIKAHTTLNFTLRVISNSSMKMLTAFEKISIANGLITGLLTNYVVRTSSFSPGGVAQSLIPVVVRYILLGSNTTCTCMIEGTCPMPGSFYLHDMWETSGLYDLNKIISNQTLSGIVVDCTPLQMVFASSLECFYNQSCVDLILSTSSKHTNISILNQFLPSRFITTTKIKSLIEHLFLEEISNKTRYNDYYDLCAPTYCSYTYSSKFDAIYILTMFMALYGGLGVGLRIIISYVINMLIFLKKKRRSMRDESQQNESKIQINHMYFLICLLTIFRNIN